MLAKAPRLAFLGVVLALPCFAANAPEKGGNLYVSAVGMEHYIPDALIRRVPYTNMECPETIAGCLYHFKPCERVRVKSFNEKSSILTIEALSFPVAQVIEGEWSLVLAPDLETCVSSLTHVQVMITGKDSRFFGRTFESDPVDCAAAHLTAPCESTRARPLIRDRDESSLPMYLGWKVIGPYSPPPDDAQR